MSISFIWISFLFNKIVAEIGFRFVDRDMFMRFRGGGIAHKATHFIDAELSEYTHENEDGDEDEDLDLRILQGEEDEDDVDELFFSDGEIASDDDDQDAEHDGQDVEDAEESEGGAFGSAVESLGYDML